MEEILNLKIILREESSPFFTDEELVFYFKKNNFDLNKTAYECFKLKAEDDSISLPGGLQLANNREYWLSLARQYKPKKRSFVL
ncbi:hypothetical protein [Paraclostridium bifermentans]|uniref:hypothetical protein n=1 Tax=Paraclostridium bifermentans TaxID=1490 RepID=UPI001C7FA387|nr:hypothetical protein [Paraclostridium bifermentans]GIM32712.1 hypothetical protein PAGU1678_19820 [Paraclostridium bifermentans subsp. muricolitidis]